MRRRRGGAGNDPADLARRLGTLLTELQLSEIEASVGDVRVRLHRASTSGTLGPTHAPVPVASPAPAESTVGAITIEAPMVGTFYRAASPGAEPYVREGDVVKQGQILCIIEAMKLMNEIESKVGGRIQKILVENGQAVEFGQPLFLLER